MSKRTNRANWLRTLTSFLNRRPYSKSPISRRVRLEQLEPRYALTAPTANHDLIVVEKNAPLFTYDAPGILTNDSDPEDGSIIVIKVNGSAANVGSPIVLPGGTLTINSDGKLTFLPEAGFDGSINFTYEIRDAQLLTDTGTGLVQVVPTASLSSPPVILEGQDGVVDEFNQEQGLWLHATGSIGPGLEYFWRIDTSPVDPASLEFDPLEDPLVFVGPDHPVSWAQLNARGVHDATNTAVITLKVVVDADSFDYAQAPLTVEDVLPETLNFAFEPDNSGGCGGTSVTMNATLDDINPLESIVSVGINWNWDIFNGEPLSTVDETLTVTPNTEDGTFSITGTHSYDPAGDQFPVLLITSKNTETDNEEQQFAFFPSAAVLGPLSGSPIVSFGPTGTLFSLTSPDTYFAYQWVVTKDGDPYSPGTPTDQHDFDFTPSESGVYVVTFTGTRQEVIGEETILTYEIYDQTVIVTGGGATVPPVGGVVLTPCGDLLVGGTDDPDTFTFTPTGTPGEIKVALNGANQGNFSPSGSVQVFGRDGTDATTVNGDSTSNHFEVHDDRLVLNGLNFYDDSVESRQINARANGDIIEVFAGDATITGGTGSDELIATGSIELTGAHAGSVNGEVFFTSIENLSGDGLGDSLTGRDVSSVWNITAADAGSVGSLDFSGFEQLVGGTANDTFRVAEGITSDVDVDGGDGADKLDYAAFVTTSVDVDLLAGAATGLGVVTGIENVTGGEADDIIRGDDNANALAGGAGNDILLGRGGGDTLYGKDGRDILIGGLGGDTILGNADEDILIAGTTDHDGSDLALGALLSEWTRTDANSSYAQRVANITSGSGLNGSVTLVGSAGPGPATVFDDGDADTLTGNGGKDWFFANVGEDSVTDQSASEFWNDTDF